jgi:hypothetical protein
VVRRDAGARRGWAAGLALLAACLVASSAEGQSRRRWGILPEKEPNFKEFNVPYAGLVTFVRLRYTPSQYGRGGGGFFGGVDYNWDHDYPRADKHLMTLVKELTTIGVQTGGSNVLSARDPELFKYPVAYMAEPGYWTLTDEEATTLRAYLRKGGFIIFDDFEAEQWYNFEAQFQRALPDAQFLELSFTHPIFHSFFEMDVVNLPHPSEPVEPGYFAVFEDNNPAGRMMALANFNSDIAEYWEFSGTGMFPVDTTNDAYKLGVNYIVYALTR